MTILLSGFAPFDGEQINPSWEAVRGFAGRSINGHQVAVTQLPVEFHVARELLAVEIVERAPELVLCVGQAGGRSAISLERVAINLADARIADNAGYQPRNQRLIDAAPTAYFAPLDLPLALQTLHGGGIPAEISLSAGSFVCNDVFFGLCHAQATVAPALRGTFLHIPYAPSQVLHRPGVASMAIEDVRRALELLITALS